MFTTILEGHGELTPQRPKEGDLFKVIRLHGKTFEIKYGFYEECDRHSKHAEPVAIYPDFITQPAHTGEGFPFVTAMQVPCAHFDGRLDENSGCEDCAAYQHGEELLGICTCLRNRFLPPGDGVGKMNESCTLLTILTKATPRRRPL